MAELKPCPFCGCKLEFSRKTSLYEVYKHPENDCLLAQIDDVSGYIVLYTDEFEKWNRRADE